MPDDRPDHRPESVPVPAGEDPRITAVIGADRFPRPGLMTWFAEPVSGGGSPDRSQDGSQAVGCHVCTCNRVRVCTCVGFGSGGSSGSSRCRCVPVH